MVNVRDGGREIDLGKVDILYIYISYFNIFSFAFIPSYTFY